MFVHSPFSVLASFSVSILSFFSLVGRTEFWRETERVVESLGQSIGRETKRVLTYRLRAFRTETPPSVAPSRAYRRHGGRPPWDGSQPGIRGGGCPSGSWRRSVGRGITSGLCKRKASPCKPLRLRSCTSFFRSQTCDVAMGSLPLAKGDAGTD